MIGWLAIVGFVVVGCVLWWLTKDAQHECYMGGCVPTADRYTSY